MKKIFAITFGLINLSAGIVQGIENGSGAEDRSADAIIDAFNSRTNVEVKCYPNPANAYLMIEPTLNSETGEIKVMDLAGRVHTELHLEPGSNGVMLDLNEYSKGLYILALYDDNSRLVHVERFTKE